MSGKQWTLDDMVDMTGKVVLVTGGNSGVGYVSSKMMLLKNAKVYIGARDSTKSHDAIKRLKEETGHDAYLIPLDLADLHSVRKAAETFLSKESKLDVLMNNAGVMATPVDQLTKDGYDLQFGVNVLGHFHLTSLLMPAILASPAPRIVNVSSKGHEGPPKEGIRFETLKGPRTESSIPVYITYVRYLHYAQSKLGNILHANELARRYGDRGLVAISIHPGFVATELMRDMTWAGNLFVQIAARAAHGGNQYTPEQGAITQLYAANAPEAKDLSGQYLIPFAKVGTPHPASQDKELAKKMWDWCENELKAY